MTIHNNIFQHSKNKIKFYATNICNLACKRRGIVFLNVKFTNHNSCVINLINFTLHGTTFEPNVNGTLNAVKFKRSLLQTCLHIIIAFDKTCTCRYMYVYNIIYTYMCMQMCNGRRSVLLLIRL